MAKNDGRKDTPVPAGLISRVAGVAVGAMRGAYEGWFGPGIPLTPIAPADELPHRFDFPYGVNLAYQPRQEQGQPGPSFGLLRAFADPGSGGLDLLRLAIETRKDQMTALKWKLYRRDKDGADYSDPKIKKVMEALRRPDGANSFSQWQRMILEDHFVIDAVALYRRQHPKGTRLEPVDGATIKVAIDKFGRRPIPPFTAYQQFLKGVPAVDYDTTELGYYVYNPRTDRLYGLSRVEQIINMISIALSRQVSLSAYYTDGSIADLMISFPKEWNVQAIKEYMEYYNGTLAGNLQQRRQAIGLPGDSKPYFPKDQILKDAFDEWLARIICYAFSLPPTSLVKEQNRSVTETQKEAAAEEGLTPTKIWFADLMDAEIEQSFGEPDVGFSWDEEEVVDQIENASMVVSMYGGATGNAKPILTLAEARDKLGLDEANPEQIAEIEGTTLPSGEEPPKPPPPPAFGEPKPPQAGEPKDGSEPEPPQNGGREASKAHRAGRALHAPSRNKAVFRRIQAAISRKVTTRLRAFGRTLAAATMAGALDATKADDPNDRINALLGKLTPEEWAAIADDVQPLLEEMAVLRAKMAAEQAVTATSDLDTLLQQANERAVAWAHARAAALVTEIQETTRRDIRQLVERQLAAGVTNDDLARQISSDYLFSRARGQVIARTETSFAETRGTVEGWRSSGQVEKKGWAISADACPECQALDGIEVAIDADFPEGGGDGPPLHPNCECSLYAVLV